MKTIATYKNLTVRWIAQERARSKLVRVSERLLARPSSSGLSISRRRRIPRSDFRARFSLSGARDPGERTHLSAPLSPK